MLIKIHKKYYRFYEVVFYESNDYIENINYISLCFSLDDYIRRFGWFSKRYYICG